MARFLTFVVITLLAMCPTRATDPDLPPLPSRDSSVVVPLLKNYTYNMDPITIFMILGKPDVDAIVKNYHDRLYNLHDGTIIHVRVTEIKAYSIFLQNSDARKIQVLYALNKKWRRP